MEHEQKHHPDLINLKVAATASEIEQTMDQFFPDALFPDPMLLADTASVPAPQYNTPVVNTEVSQDSEDFVAPIPPATATITNQTRAPVPATIRDMPPGKTHTGDLITATRTEADRDANILRMWEQPSLMVGGFIYRKVTEHVILSDGTSYESIIEEMEKAADDKAPRSKKHK